MKKVTITLIVPTGISTNKIKRAVESFDSDPTITVEEREEHCLIYYPSNPLDIRQVVVSFCRPVSKDAVEDIAEYWGSLPYVGEFSGVDFMDGKAYINVDVSKTRSHNVSQRCILELLFNFLEEGTPMRKDGTRAVDGFGSETVMYIKGLTENELFS